MEFSHNFKFENFISLSRSVLHFSYSFFPNPAQPLQYTEKSNPKAAMEKFSKWRYAKAMLFTLGEMLLIYTFPLAAMSSAIATFVAPVAVDPILEKVRFRKLLKLNLKR
jgi:hypothetical protein